ncbi:MAG: hypothetical protein Kow00100_18980 [Geothermobacteraceae bacterium]
MKFLRLLTLLLVSLLPLAGPVRAEFSGVAEWGYAEYRESRDGVGDLRARSLTQQYSLLWEKSGEFYNGKAGKYDLALGGEWSWLDADLDGENVDIETAKILYRGDILFAPGGLPFRVQLYSHDDHKSLFQEDTIGFLTRDTGDPIEPDIVTDLVNGQHIVTGATLLVGIRNGSYLGRYRDVLSQLPRLLVDYREIYVRDVHTETPQHYRERNLAFVSLNKKDNWFHYRYTDFKDFMDPDGASDYVEKSYLLGTIDHQQVRRWINITNWIQISADGSYTVTEQPNSQQDATERRYSLNFFTQMQRSNWGASNFTTYLRETEFNRLHKKLEIPFYARGELDRSTAWRFQFIGSRDQELVFSTDTQRDVDTAYLSAQVETFRQGRYIFAPKFEIESKGGEEGDGYAARATAEFYSNVKYRPKYEIYGSYSLARFAGENRNGEDSGSWEQQAIGRIETSLAPRARVGLEQQLIYSSGTVDQDVSDYIQPRSLARLEGSVQDPRRLDGSSFRSKTILRGEFTSEKRLDNTVELIFDYLVNDLSTDHQLIVRHRLEYDRRTFRASMLNEFMQGDVANFDTFSFQVIDGSSGGGTLNSSYEHRTRLFYSPGRAWETTGEFHLQWRRGDLGDTTNYDISQSLTYNFYVVNGLVRKLAIIRQELEYESFNDYTGLTANGTKLSLLGEVYPTRHTLFGLRGTFEHLSTGEDTYTMLAVAALNFEKFQVRLEYEYGTDDDQDAQRWEVNVRKIF